MEDWIYITEHLLNYSDRKVQNLALLLDFLTETLWLLIRSPVHERGDCVQEGVSVPLRVEDNPVRDQTGEKLAPTELEIPFLLLRNGIVELVFVKVENLR